ncbi:MAG: tetratricopeptide repeat protein [Rhodospirillales bacterium]
MVSLQQAFASHQAGNLTDAVQLYRHFIAANPQHAEAHHLLGVACMQMGNLQDAMESLSQAVHLDGNNPGYLNNLGLAQFYGNDPVAARKNYERAHALTPQNPDILNNLGMALQRLGEVEGAIKKFEAALKLSSDDPEILHNYGMALRDAGLLEKAAVILKRAIDVSGGIPDTYAALASIQFTLDDYDGAVKSCWSSIRMDPLHLDSHKAFKGLMKAMNRDAEIYDTLKWAVENAPDVPQTHVQYGLELAQDGAYAVAEPVLRRAIELDGNLAIARSTLGWALSHMGQHDEAVMQYAKAVELAPDDPSFLDNYGQCLIRAGRPTDAIAVLKKAHRMMPRLSAVLGTMTIAMVEADDPSLAAFVDYEKDVVTRVLSPPPGYADIETFNDALHAELEPRHKQGSLPLDQSMRGGTQIPDNLFKSASGNVLLVKNAITAAIGEFVAGLDEDPDHPFLRYINKDFRFSGAWSTILYGAGYDGSHIHNEGWLSGVYYVKAPDLPEESWLSGEGCIQFGAPPDAFVSDKNKTRRLIRPQPGLLVLFPSYIWHGVKPFTQEGLRHSIAFDVI